MNNDSWIEKHLFVKHKNYNKLCYSGISYNEIIWTLKITFNFALWPCSVMRCAITLQRNQEKMSHCHKIGRNLESFVIKNTNFMCIFPLPIKAWLFKWPYFTETAPLNSPCLQCKYWTRISNERKAVLELIWKGHDIFTSLAIRYWNLCMLLLVLFLSVIPIFLHWKLYNSNNSLKLHWCGFIFCSSLFIIALV